MKTCAIIPAAGRGSRLGLDGPKILAPLSPQATVWTVLRDNLIDVVDHVHVVLSSSGQAAFERALEGDPFRNAISTSVQHEPTGMGDAIFTGYPVWSQANRIIVIWGDQVAVSRATLTRALALHADDERTLVLPVVGRPDPYVQYVFDETGRLRAIRESREGDHCEPGALGDVGTFVLSVAGLLPAWQGYRALGATGALTREVNFLPFLVYLAVHSWTSRSFEIADVRESRGINTPDDLAFFRRIYGDVESETVGAD